MPFFSFEMPILEIKNLSLWNGKLPGGYRMGEVRGWPASKMIFPHHTFHGFFGSFVIFRVSFFIVIPLDLPFHAEIDELSDGHAGIDADGMGAGDLQRPGITEADVALAGRGMDVDAQAAYAGFAFQKGNRLMGFCIFFRDAQIEGAGMEDEAFLWYFGIFDPVVFPCIEYVVFVTGQPFSQMHIIGIGSQAFPTEWFDDDLAVLYTFQYFYIA